MRDVAFHKLSMRDLIHIFGITPQNLTNGLSENEVTIKRNEFGANVFSEKKQVPIYVALLKKYCQPFNLLLLVAATLSFVLYVIDRSDYSNICLSFGILLVSVLNALLEFYQEYKTNELLRGFEKLVPSVCTVVRDSIQCSVSASDLVVGDLVMLKVGDKIPADVRLLTATKLTVDNSSLTGESIPVIKKPSQDDLYDEIVFERDNKVAVAVQNYEQKMQPIVSLSVIRNGNIRLKPAIKESGSRNDTSKDQNRGLEGATELDNTFNSSRLREHPSVRAGSVVESLNSSNGVFKTPKHVSQERETLQFTSEDQNTSILSFDSQINPAQKCRPFIEETLPKKTNTPQNLGEYERASNMVFSGDLITTGKGTGIVVATGNSTLLGKIASMTVSDSGKQNELTAEIDAYVRRLGLIALGVSIVFYAIAIYNGFTIKENLVFCVGIFIAFVPQGLPATVTILLSIAAKQMAKVNVLVKDLRAVETLGAVSLLATDKTGTLTMGDMKVQAIWDGTGTSKVAENRSAVSKNYTSSNTSQQRKSKKASANVKNETKTEKRDSQKVNKSIPSKKRSNNKYQDNIKENSSRNRKSQNTKEALSEFNFSKYDLNHGGIFEVDQNSQNTCTGGKPINKDGSANEASKLARIATACRAIIGPGIHADPTERALKTFAENHCLSDNEHVVFEEPFDSNTKLHVAIVENSGKYRVVVKGAPDRLIKHTISYGVDKQIDDRFMEEFHVIYESFASLGQRVVAVAEREISKQEVDAILESDSSCGKPRDEKLMSGSNTYSSDSHQLLENQKPEIQGDDNLLESGKVSSSILGSKDLKEGFVEKKSIAANKTRKESKRDRIEKYMSNIFTPKCQPYQSPTKIESTQNLSTDHNKKVRRSPIRNLTTDQIFSRKNSGYSNFETNDFQKRNKGGEHNEKRSVSERKSICQVQEADRQNDTNFSENAKILVGGFSAPSEGETNHTALHKDTSIPKDNLHFLGLVGIVDPPKIGVRNAVMQLRLAGVQVVMVTGDHPLTATNIARRILLISGITKIEASKILKIPIDLVKPDDYEAEVIHGDEIDLLLPSDWERIFKRNEVVFARTSPAQKMRIVEMYQKIGHIVGVSGDGVNDAPALRKANLGIAMNTTGSDVSKEAAHMILKDDNFASIVFGVHLGRLVFCNLRKSVRYLLSHITPQVVPFLIFVGLGIPTPMSAVLLMLIDLFTEFFPSIALAWEPCEGNLMVDLPRKHAAIISHGLQNEICEISVGYGQFSDRNITTTTTTTTTMSNRNTEHKKLSNFNESKSFELIDKGIKRTGKNTQEFSESAERKDVSQYSNARSSNPKQDMRTRNDSVDKLGIHEKNQYTKSRNPNLETYEIPPSDDLNIQTTCTIGTKIKIDNQKTQKGEYLCDTNTLSWAYFEAGVIITLGALAAFFATFLLNGIPLSALVMSSKVYFKQSSPDLFVDSKKIDSSKQLEILHSAQSAYFIGILLGQAFNILICKNSNGIFTKQTMKNKLPFVGTLISLLFGSIIVMTNFANNILMSKPIHAVTLIFPILAGLSLLFWDFTRKKLRRRFDVFGIKGAQNFLGVQKVKRKYLPAPPEALAP